MTDMNRCENRAESLVDRFGFRSDRFDLNLFYLQNMVLCAKRQALSCSVGHTTPVRLF